jgi:type II protein arginine methyltransferase
MFDKKRLDSDTGMSFSEYRQLPLRRDFPTWHFAMVNDQARNAAIETAIAALDLTGKTVFEIGAGTGLIALLFAKYGARHVHTCESNRTLAAVAQSIVETSPHGNRITVLAGTSSEVIDWKQVPSQPDVIFTETVDCGIVGEGFFEIRRDIQRLAGPQTLVLPDEINQFACLIASPQIRGLNYADTVCGFDLSALNMFSTRNYFPVRSALYDFAILTRPQIIRTYSYVGDCSPPSRTLTVEHDGIADGLLTWFNLEFAHISVSNSLDVASHWHQAFHPLPQPVPIKAGGSLDVSLSDAGIVRID